MRLGAAESTTDRVFRFELPNAACRPADEADAEVPELGGPRIALLTPYSGGNLGDAAIQDAMIANLRLRLPGAQFSGVTLNCDNFVEQHGVGAFPLCGANRPFYGMSRGTWTRPPGQRERHMGGAGRKGLGLRLSQIKRALKSVPVLGPSLKKGRLWVAAIPREIRHAVLGYRFLRTQDLLIVSGGGQLDEEFGGPWGHPFALFKWAVLARVARVPYVMASVGAQRAESTACRLFMSAALRLASYRSYRDKNSREIAAGLLQRAAEDPVVPDLAFSLPSSELPSPAGLRATAQGRTIAAISPIAYAKPGSWPYEDCALYDRYLQQMARVVAQLLEGGYFLVLAWSGLPDDRVIHDLLGCLGHDSRKKLAGQVHVPAITTWKDLVALLQDVDFLIASRLHSVIFGFLAQQPTIAISFDPKVDWVMEDLGQADYLLQIRNFAAEDVIKALDRIEGRRELVLEQIASYRRRVVSAFALQYDALAELALANHRRRN